MHKMMNSADSSVLFRVYVVLGTLWKASRRVLGRAGTVVVRDLSSSIHVKLYRIPPGDLACSQAARRKAKCKWVLHWDADFVAFEYMPKYVRNLIEELNPQRHYLVYWYYILLCGDVRHLCSGNPLHVEYWLFTYSSSLRYSNVPYGGGVVFDVLIASPTPYKAIRLNKVMGVHLVRVRSCRNMVIKFARSEHRDRFMELTARGLHSRRNRKGHSLGAVRRGRPMCSGQEARRGADQEAPGVPRITA